MGISSKRIAVTFFQRRPRAFGNTSIEAVFSDVRQRLSGQIDCRLHLAPFLSNGLFRRLANMLDAPFYQGDVNHITGDIHYCAFCLSKRRTVLTILDCGNAGQAPGIKGWLMRKLWFAWPTQRSAVVTTISEASKQEIMRITSCRPDKIVVIPVAISSEYQYVPKEFNQSKPTILQVGTIVNKNVERLIQAIEGLACRLVIIGLLSDSQKQLLQAAQLDYVNYPRLSQSDLIQQYVQADIVAFASLVEGFGMPIVEAQTTGRVVVTSSISSMPEVAGKGACFVDPFDIRSIRDGILKVITDEQYRIELVEAGRMNVRRFDPAAIAQQYYDVYLKVFRSLS